MIKEITYNDIKDIKIDTYGVIKKDKGKYYGLFINDKLVAFLNIWRFNKWFKLDCNYTLPEYRGNGYFTTLLKYVIELYKNYPLRADCLDSSYPIYEKLGFNKVNEKQFKYFKVHYMERS